MFLKVKGVRVEFRTQEFIVFIFLNLRSLSVALLSMRIIEFTKGGTHDILNCSKPTKDEKNIVDV
jgi:hypothetical protein